MRAYLMTMDDDSADEEPATAQPRKHQKAVSGKLRTADNTVVNQITWPHELIYTPAGQPAVYEYVSPMMFVNGYLEVLARVEQDTKVQMLSHWQELMTDGEACGWPIILVYHTAWLQHLEPGRAMCGDHDTKLKLRHVLVWHRVAPNPKAAATSTQPRKQPVNTRNQRRAGPLSEVAQPRAKVCISFNKG